MKQGKVFLVGAGPGDPGLFTLKGRAVLESADVVVYDALVGQGILHMIPPKARRIDVGKRAGSHPVPQEEINQILLREALAGSVVVRLKGGDPFLFGRGGEELELLTTHEMPYEIVPGVTSAVAVPAYAGIPVTHRDYCSSVHIITGHTKKNPGAEIDYEALTRLDGTLVFLMGVSALESICAGLIAGGMSPAMPAAVLERGTSARQRRILSDLAHLPLRAAEEGVQTPAIILVGRVCALSEQFAWAEKRALGGRRVVVTRPRERGSKLTSLLREQGAEVVELPAIEIHAIPQNLPLEQALERLKTGDYRWLVFTSPAGVELFFAHLQAISMDIRALGSVNIAAIGSATARELEQRGLIPTLVPDRYCAAALGQALADAVESNHRVLIARAKEGSPQLTTALDQVGISYDDIPLYETRIASAGELERLAALDADYVAFTSASTVRGFVEAMDLPDFSAVHGVCIGEETAREARRHGMCVTVAKSATLESMIAAMTKLSEGAG